MTNKLLIVTDGKAGTKTSPKPSVRLWDTGTTACARATRPASTRPVLPDRPPGAGVGFPFTIEKTDGYYAAVVCTGSTAFYPGKIAARRRGIPSPRSCFPVATKS
jgi:hypothetical protein